MLPRPDEDDSGWLEEGPGAGAPLLVAFGGMPTRPGEPPAYEFRSVRERVGAHGLFLRDHHESWYLRGVSGIGGDIDSVLAWLAEQRARLQPSRTVFLGNSAGAYVALAAGALLDTDEVLAFAPRSALTDEVNDALDDHRYLDRRRLVAGLDTPLSDLPALITGEAARRVAEQGEQPYRTRLRVFHASDNVHDSHHAARLVGLPETVVTAYPRGDHHVASVLRASGELDAIVAAALAGPRGLTVAG